MSLANSPDAEGMDETDYALGRSHSEYDRLIEQAELLRSPTERVLRAAGISLGMRVLDVGCGVGDVSFLAAELVGTDGAVVGVDLDGDALQVADRRQTEQGTTNVSFRQGDPRVMEFDQIFDAAIGRFVLMYMSDPAAALRLMADRVRVGGVLVFHEWVTSGAIVPASTQPMLASLQELIRSTFERSGANLHTGAELYASFLGAGLEPNPQPLAEVAITMNREAGYRRWELFVRGLSPKIIEYGLATSSELDSQLRRLREEVAAGRGPVPVSWLMIGQWGRTLP